MAWAEYQPFGLQRTGGLAASAPELAFGFTGELTDPAGLVHLRTGSLSRTGDGGLGSD